MDIISTFSKHFITRRRIILPYSQTFSDSKSSPHVHFLSTNVYSEISAFRELFPSSRLKKRTTVTAARQFIQNIQATMGNTEVYHPLHSYFLLSPTEGTRNVILVSDGHINNEEVTRKAMMENYQHTRLFTCGVR